MGELIETVFVMLTRVDARNYVLDRIKIPYGMGHFWGVVCPKGKHYNSQLCKNG